MTDLLSITAIYLQNPDTLITLSYLCLGSFALLFCLGITDSIIIYFDLKDLLWSLGIIIFPVGGLIFLSFLAPEITPETYSFFWETTNHKIISGTSLIGTGFSVLKTLLNCIANNGLILGSIIFLFKLFAAIISVLVILGVFNQFTSKSKSFRSIIITMIIFGLFSYFMRRLINGERVLEKRSVIKN